MYKVKRFYSEPQNKTTVQLESQSVDSSDYEYYVKAINGDLREVSDEEVVKMVLDTIRIKLNPNEAVATLDEKTKELDNLIERSEEQMLMSQMAMFELTETVYGLIESVTNLKDAFEAKPDPVEPEEPEEPTEPEPEPMQEPMQENGEPETVDEDLEELEGGE